MKTKEIKREKNLQDVLKEDLSLQRRITVREFQEGKVNPENTDWKLEDAYNTYCRAKKQ